MKDHKEKKNACLVYIGIGVVFLIGGLAMRTIVGIFLFVVSIFILLFSTLSLKKLMRQEEEAERAKDGTNQGKGSDWAQALSLARKKQEAKQQQTPKPAAAPIPAAPQQDPAPTAAASRKGILPRTDTVNKRAEERCGHCDQLFPQEMLHQIDNRQLCESCFSELYVQPLYDELYAAEENRAD